MEAVMGWMKGIVILFVILTAFMHLIPDKKYRRYVRFFAEMVLIAAVVQPIAEIIYAGESFADKVEYTQFWQEMENLQKDSKKLDFMQPEYYRGQYEKAIAKDAAGMLENEEWEVTGAEADLTEEYELKRIELTVTLTEKEGQSTDGAAGKLAKLARQEQAEGKIREKLKTYYQLEDEAILLTFE